MTLLLKDSIPEISVKSGFLSNEDKVYITIDGNKSRSEVSFEDFCYLVEYFMENTDLVEDDPRLLLLEKLKKMKIIDGWNKGKKRLGWD